jgi:iron(III) transport system substrate-binding protein
MKTHSGLTILPALALLFAGCQSEKPPAAETETPKSITIYSGRNEKLIGPLLDRFSESHGIEVEVRYASTSELTATLMEEGEHTPADLFIAQDAAALGALSRAGALKQLPETTLALVPARFRGPDGDWVGISGRARVVVYNTELIQPDELPQSLMEVTDSRFAEKFGVAPGNASFQAHMAAYRAINGDEALEPLLVGMAANKPKIYPKNTPIVEAVIAGEIEWGLVNHYYLLRALAERPDAPAKNYLMPGEDGSDFVNVAGVARLGDNSAALELIDYLLSTDAQRYFSEETHEYPLIESLAPDSDLGAGDLDALRVNYADVSESLEPTLVMIQSSGLTRFQ